ncbi:hypothetical protein ACLMJK_000833 [Lecanora helva]
MIQTPHTLADIPQDLTGSIGQVLASDVYSITATERKKRSELAVAIDRQGINLYNLKKSTLVTSYAVSPQALFTCPPCSTLVRTLAGKQPQRLTYCSVNSPKAQIICFSEAPSTNSDAIGTIETSSRTLDEPNRSIISLETLCCNDGHESSSSTLKVLAIYQDGGVSCYTRDLDIEEWTIQASSIHGLGSNLQVHLASVVSLETARKALLKDREDVLVSLNAAGEESTGDLLLLAVQSTDEKNSEGPSQLSVLVFDIDASNPTTKALSIDNARRLKLLASMSIQGPPQAFAQKLTITMHVASGTMYQNFQGSFTIYDLTGFIARPAKVLDLDHGPSSSYIRVSANTFACSTPTSLSIIALPYSLVQSELTIEDMEGVQNAVKGSQGGTGFRLLSYSGPSEVLIAHHRRKLLVFPLSSALLQRKRKRKGLLIDSLGRASLTTFKRSPTQSVSDRNIKSLGTYIVPSCTQDDKSWENHKAEMNRLASDSDEEGFEQKAFSLLGLDALQSHNTQLPRTSRPLMNQRGLYLILSTIFLVDKSLHSDSMGTPTGPSTLKLRFFPRRFCNWLIEQGFLTVSRVEKSLKRSGALPSTSSVAPGTLVQILAECDCSLEMLSNLIASPSPVSSKELVHAITIVTQNSNAAKSANSPNLLTGAQADGSDNGMQVQLTNGQIENHSPPPPTFPEGKHNHRILAMILKKLYSIPSASVSRALKSELSTTQLRIFVDALRMEIAQSGWLSPYIETMDLPDPDYRDNHQLCYIAHVLNCAIDSIGTGGWLLGAPSPNTEEFHDTADTIAYMKAEISAALEGIEEAIYLEGILKEMLLCGKNFSQSKSKQLTRPEDGKIPKSGSAGAIVMAEQEMPHALPLGLKPAQTISTTRVGAGGELIKRSMRHIGRQKSRMVGKYSFERIVI